MQRSLVRHPQSPVGPIDNIDVTLEQRGARWSVTYRACGAIEAVIVPDSASAPKVTDDLWRNTCFEAFMRADDADYTEFNLSPSGHWAAYRFADYRKAMMPAAIDPPDIATRIDASTLVLRALLPLQGILGLSAVIEANDSSKSYWALAHPPGAPDFHHRDCFALTLPPRTRA